MILELGALAGRVVRVDRDLTPADLDLDADTAVVRTAHLKGEAQEGDRGVEFRGRLEATVELACGRCLEAYEVAVGADFRLLVVRAEPLGREVAEGEATDILEAPDGRVDLNAVGREQLLLGLPLKQVCGPECLGLCPTCGENRNRIKCGCSTDEPDPRLAPLEALKKRLERS